MAARELTGFADRARARRLLLDLYGESIERGNEIVAAIDRRASDEELAALIAARQEAEQRQRPLIEEARMRARRLDTLGRHPQPRPRSSRGPRRSTRTHRPRARAPASSSDGDDPEPPVTLDGLRAASIRAWAHERRRAGARRVA